MKTRWAWQERPLGVNPRFSHLASRVHRRSGSEAILHRLPFPR